MTRMTPAAFTKLTLTEGDGTPGFDVPPEGAGGDYSELFAQVAERANSAAAEFDAGISLGAVNGNTAEFEYTDEDGDVTTTAKVEALGKAHGMEILRITLNDGDGSPHIVGASGVNVFRCFYV